MIEIDLFSVLVGCVIGYLVHVIVSDDVLNEEVNNESNA